MAKLMSDNENKEYYNVVNEDKESAVTGTKGYQWLEAEEVKAKHLEDWIDMGYFDKLPLA